MNKSEIVDKCLLLSIYSIFLFLPWYYNASGQIQPVDISIIITALFLIFRQRFLDARMFFCLTYPIMLILIVYLFLRYTFAYAYTASSLHEVFANAYYIFLLTVFLFVLLYLHSSRPLQAFYESSLNCLLISILLPLGTLLFFGANYGLAEIQKISPTIVRPVLTFNNANQLGFFALTNLSLFFYINLFVQGKNIKIKKIISLVIINSNLIFLLLSVSRAVSPAIILYFYSNYLIFQPNYLKKRPYLLWAGISLMTITWFFCAYLYHHFLLVQTGISSAIKIGFTDDFYERAIRGISYNFSNIFLFIFGYGSTMNPLRANLLEYHNNFLSIFNQGGIVGFLLYFCLIATILIELLKKGIIYLLPFLCYLVYSEMHYAFRTRMNWLFFAMLIFLFIQWRLASRSSDHKKQSWREGYPAKLDIAHK